MELSCDTHAIVCENNQQYSWFKNVNNKLRSCFNFCTRLDDGFKPPAKSIMFDFESWIYVQPNYTPLDYQFVIESVNPEGRMRIVPTTTPLPVPVGAGPWYAQVPMLNIDLQNMSPGSRLGLSGFAAGTYPAGTFPQANQFNRLYFLDSTPTAQDNAFYFEPYPLKYTQLCPDALFKPYFYYGVGAEPDGTPSFIYLENVSKCSDFWSLRPIYVEQYAFLCPVQLTLKEHHCPKNCQPHSPCSPDTRCKRNHVQIYDTSRLVMKSRFSPMRTQELQNHHRQGIDTFFRSQTNVKSLTSDAQPMFVENEQRRLPSYREFDASLQEIDVNARVKYDHHDFGVNYKYHDGDLPTPMSRSNSSHQSLNSRSRSSSRTQVFESKHQNMDQASRKSERHTRDDSKDQHQDDSDDLNPITRLTNTSGILSAFTSRFAQNADNDDDDDNGDGLADQSSDSDDDSDSSSSSSSTSSSSDSDSDSESDDDGNFSLGLHVKDLDLNFNNQ